MGEKLIEDFNEFFEGQAKAIIDNGKVRITIGSKTAIFHLPEFIGGHSEQTLQIDPLPRKATLK
jgi:aspartate/methionine/tyrosine aminotransferase